jgi:phage tail-like protein
MVMKDRSGLLMRSLPGVYQSAQRELPEGSEYYLPELLNALEGVLFGPEDERTPGLAQKLDAIPDLFDPGMECDWLEDRRELLVWLSRWVALSNTELFSDELLRATIARIVPMYSYRGTRRYLQELLALLAPDFDVQVDDEKMPELVVGFSRVGRESRLGGDLPFWFFVRARLLRPGTAEVEDWDALDRRLRILIDTAKPAHTAYQLDFEVAQEQAATLTEKGFVV